MQAAMDRLERLVTRHRKVVLGIWVVVLLASLPFAAQQTKHLTAGGFEVPGSGSLTASQALKRFPGVKTEPLILVFDNHARNAAKLSSAVNSAAAGLHGVANVSVSPQAVGAAKAAGSQPVVLLPLNIAGGADEAVDAAVDVRKALDINGQGAVAVPVHLVGQQ